MAGWLDGRLAGGRATCVDRLSNNPEPRPVTIRRKAVDPLLIPAATTIFLPRSKADHGNQDRTYSTPALKRLCLSSAYLDWLSTAGIIDGPVFRCIGRWVGYRRRRSTSTASGCELYGSHSLRRGFSARASASGWNQKSLMSYVRWRDAKSARITLRRVRIFPACSAQQHQRW